MTPEELQERLLYRDGLMLVIDKPAGLPVHRGPRGGPALEDFLPALAFGLPNPPALAHRLDSDTSGCLVLGRHRKALARLGALFAAGEVEKTYWAVTLQAPPEAEGRIALPLAKESRRDRGWRMKVDPGGQPAVSDYRLRGKAGGLAWLELKPRTGRTHQLRVHLAAIGCPILGDRLYGGALAPDTLRLHLHARAVAVPLYPKRPPVTCEAPLPPDIAGTFLRCGWEGKG